MKFNLFTYFLALSFFIFCNQSFGQGDEGKTQLNTDATGKFEIKQAGWLEGSTDKFGTSIRKVKNNVIFKQGNTILYCDSAIQYENRRKNIDYIDAFGHVRIKQGDSLNVTGNTLHYDGKTKLANLKGNVVLINKKTRVMTEQMNFETNTGVAYYYSGATIKDGNNTLTSQRGSYNSNTEYFRFKDSVKLVNPQYEIDCDTLDYSGNSKVAYFKGPTNIKSESGTLFANDGEYNTVTGKSSFGRSAAIENDEYKLIGDRLTYNEDSKIGHAVGNVELTLKKKDIIIYGDEGSYFENTGISRTHGHVLMKYLMGKDTLYLKADTMISHQDSARQGIDKILAFPKVRFFRDDLKGQCDSLAYEFNDSTISFYIEPILWSQGSQLSGQHIRVLLDSNQIDKMFVDEDAFMVMEEKFKQYNQIKGKDMVAHFNKGELKLLDVLGNGQSIYYAMENDSVLMGMNKTVCSNMKIHMDSSKVQNITFLKNPEAKFIPPKRILAPDRELPGFEWHGNLEPKFEEFIINKIRGIVIESKLPDSLSAVGLDSSSSQSTLSEFTSPNNTNKSEIENSEIENTLNGKEEDSP